MTPPVPLSPLRVASREELANGLLGVVDALATGLLLVREDGKIAFANPRACHILERSPDQLEGASIAASIAPLSELLPDLHTGERLTRPVRLASGRSIVIEYTVAEVATDPEWRHYLIAFHDVTPVLRLQEERDRLLKLATVGEVLPSILHELRNPLAAVATALELLVEEVEPGSLQRDLHAILRELRRALLGLDGIGVVGREVRSASLGAIDQAVRECCAVLAPRAEQSGIVLEDRVGSLPLLYIDPAVVRAVVFNLVNNAVQACREGGTIVVDARVEHGGSLVVEVTDDGAGMTPDVLARCTEMFFTTKRSGSGLGLPLCKQLAESAGGELEIDSEPGRGTRVRWRIPAAGAPSAGEARRGEGWTS
ncbi:MAG TPA: ATP-binding protein [Sandaracinaceae bacterium]